MKKMILTIISLCTIQLWAVNLEEVKSNFDFEKSIEMVKEQLKKKNLTLIADVPHSKAAEKVDMKLNNVHLLLFGNPEVGTLLMQGDITVAIELPLKILIWENEDGEVMLGYKKPSKLLFEYDLEDKAAVLGKMDKTLENIVKIVRQ